MVLMPLCSSLMQGQNFPDRAVIVDPLADRSRHGAGTTWLPGTVLYAEFSRYTNPAGDDHRWNAKTGGALEVVRFDSSTSIAVMGTVEVIADPQNDISFNPRAIFWEEGVIASHQLASDVVFQWGYMHRCKHDIDNLEVLTHRGATEQRTLIYSSLTTRVLLRPRSVLSTDLQWGLAVRNDFFTHLLDDRLRSDARGVGRSMEAMIDAVTVDLRGRWTSPWRWLAVGVNVGLMATLVGEEEGFLERFSGLRLLGNLPYAEFGLHFFNFNGGSFVLYTRAEYQRDAAIQTIPVPKELVMVGIRMGSWNATW